MAWIIAFSLPYIFDSGLFGNMIFVVPWLAGWLINLLFGLILRRPRPFVAYPKEVKLLFKPFTSWKSFPSDHAMTAFYFFLIAWHVQIPLFWILLPLALWVVWSRIYSGVHYPIDSIGGFLVGLFAFVLFVIFDIYYRLYMGDTFGQDRLVMESMQLLTNI